MISDFLMYFNTVYIYSSRVGSQLSCTAYRTVVFTFATADAYALVYNRTHIAVFGLHHRNSARGTMTLTVAARLKISLNYLLVKLPKP